jgi:pyruvate ferredoxin oxidoreductase alpha subunit
MRDEGIRIGVLGITSFRPFPLQRVRHALKHAKRAVIVEKSLAVGVGGVVAMNVRSALSGLHLHGYTVVAGLGGRAITKKSLHQVLRKAIKDELEHVSFLDLDWKLVHRVLEREKETRRSGPIAEGILRDIGVVASRIG